MNIMLLDPFGEKGIGDLDDYGFFGEREDFSGPQPCLKALSGDLFLNGPQTPHPEI